jgi:hypothetical protein
MNKQELYELIENWSNLMHHTMELRKEIADARKALGEIKS